MLFGISGIRREIHLKYTTSMIYKSTFAICFSILFLFGRKKNQGEPCGTHEIDPAIFSFEIMQGENLISDSVFLASIQIEWK